MLSFFYDKKMIFKYFILFSMIDTAMLFRKLNKIKERNTDSCIKKTTQDQILIFEYKLKNKLKQAFKKQIIRIFDILDKNIDKYTKAKVASHVINITAKNMDRIARDALDELRYEYGSQEE
jgi:hypothetical protein